MDLGPIPNFRPVSAHRSWPIDPELPAVVRAENSAKPGRDSSNRRPPSGAQDEDFADLAGDVSAEVSPAEGEAPSGGEINFFA